MSCASRAYAAPGDGELVFEPVVDDLAGLAVDVDSLADAADGGVAYDVAQRVVLLGAAGQVDLPRLEPFVLGTVALTQHACGQAAPEHHGVHIAGERGQFTQHRPWLRVEQQEVGENDERCPMIRMFGSKLDRSPQAWSQLA